MQEQVLILILPAGASALPLRHHQADALLIHSVRAIRQIVFAIVQPEHALHQLLARRLIPAAALPAYLQVTDKDRGQILPVEELAAHLPLRPLLHHHQQSIT